MIWRIQSLVVAALLALPSLAPHLAMTQHTAHTPQTGQAWTVVGRLSHMLDRPAVAIGHDGDIYVFGGMDNANGYNVYNSTYTYHPRTNKWTRGTAMAIAREGAQAVTLPDGRIVVLGGSPGCPNSSSPQLCFATSRVDVYTPRTNRWSILAPMLCPRYRFNAVWLKGQIYAIGGLDGTTPLASAEAYDPHTNRWHYVANLPLAMVASAAVAGPHGYIYVMGGSSARPSLYNSLYIYDGHQWVTGAAMPQATQDYAATFGPDGKIYAFGGWNNGDLTTVQVYDPWTGLWSIGPALPAPLCCMGAATTPGGSIYIIGGDDAQGVLYKYHPAAPVEVVSAA